MKSTNYSSRIWELDFLRGIALLIMVVYHTAYDLELFFGHDTPFDSFIILVLIAKLAAISFVTLCGISCALSRNNLKRGLKVLALAIIISIATHLFDPQFGVKFGILHLLGVSILLYIPLRKLKPAHLGLIGIAIIIAQFILPHIKVSSDFFFMLGLYTPGFASGDYFPMIPWTGVLLLGAAAGKLLYKQKKSIFRYSMPDNTLSLAGRHSLLIYITHQPIIMGILYILDLLKII